MSRAFTLVELLVCIAVIAILAALLFPVFAKAKSGAKVASCQSNLKQIASSLLLYASDNDDALLTEVHPYIGDGLASGRHPYGEPWDSALKSAPRWPTAPLRYGAVRESFRCPLDTGGQPDHESLRPAYSHYGTSYLNDTLGGLVFKTTSTIPNPSERTLLFDSLGSNHGSDGITAFGTLVSCASYDTHVRTAPSGMCSNGATEPPPG